MPRLSKLDPGFAAGVFSFVLSIAFVPWFSSMAETPRWVLIAIGSCAALWIPVQMRAEHWIGSALLLFAALSLAWTASFYDGLDQLFKLAFLAGLFLIGGWLPSMKPVYIGFALGFAVNSAFAIAQWYGWQGTYMLGDPAVLFDPAGLFRNKNYLAEPAAMLLAALIGSRLWWYIPGILPSVFMPNARGAFAGLAAAFVAWLWTKSRLAAIGLMAGGLMAGAVAFDRGYGGTSTTERKMIWSSTISGLTFAGHGLGSFRTLFPSHAPEFNFLKSRPAHAHNDYLEMAYELGPGVLLYLAMIVLALWGPFGAEKLVLIVFLTEGVFAFPLHFPVTAAMAALAAGRLCRDRVPLRNSAYLRGISVRLRMAIFGFIHRDDCTARTSAADVPARLQV